MQKVLLVYGTRWGTTEEIAQKIAKIMEDEGLEVNSHNLSGLKLNAFPDPSQYQGILVGSSIKVTKWKKEPKQFLEKNIELFKKGETSLGIFISCGAGGDPEGSEHGKKIYIEKVANELGINLDVYDCFGGYYDFTENSRMGKLTRKILKIPLKKMLNLEAENGKVYEFRDWQKIENFAKDFATIVKKK